MTQTVNYNENVMYILGLDTFSENWELSQTGGNKFLKSNFRSALDGSFKGQQLKNATNFILHSKFHCFSVYVCSRISVINLMLWKR